MSKRRGLGRGLDALLGAEPTVAVAEPASSGTLLAVGRLVPNRYQPRNDFDDSGLDELAESIKTQGIVQPIVVTPTKGDRYTIVAGERRWRAARRAGLEQVPVVVRDVADDQELLELALVENVQRADLNPVEEAEAFRSLSDKFALSQEEIGRRVGKSRTTVTNAMRLLRLPAEILDLLREGRLNAGQARPLIAVSDRGRQLELARRAVAEGLTARTLEKLAAEDGTQPAPRAKRKKPKLDANTRAARERLTQALQTRVDIVRKRRGGEVRIHYHSEEELIRVYDRLTQGSE